jgi:hypothetical protein
MIATIRGYRGLEYVALHLDKRTSEPVWVPIRGDRGSAGEVSQIAAITMCVGDLRKQIEPAAHAAQELHTLCDRRRPRTMEEEQRVSHLARQVADSLGRAWGDLSRLLDEPGDDDRVAMDAQPMTAAQPQRQQHRHR